MTQPRTTCPACGHPVTSRPVVWSHAETLAALERFKLRYPDLYQRVRGKKAVDHAGR